jgi:tetratricopeptide (TPR) repeat protein
MAALALVALGVRMSYRKTCLVNSSLVKASFIKACVVASLLIPTGFAQVHFGQVHSEQVQIGPPLARAMDGPPPGATALQLEQQADGLRAQKLYLDALDYYRAALARKDEESEARVLNKIGITELMMQRYKEAKKSFERSIHSDRKYADAYNNLGVIYYETRKYGAAVKEYLKAIERDGSSASFYSNLGAAYFSKRAFDPAVAAYQHALEIDPDVFARTSRAGVQAQLPSPEDRAKYDFTVAKLYAKMGLSERSLEYLRKAREEGYKDLKSVYKDVEFAELRKNPRFTEMMAASVPGIAN